MARRMTDAQANRAGRATAVPPGSPPGRSVTRGEAESPGQRATPSGQGTDSTESRTRKRQPATEPSPKEAPKRADRVFVLDADGRPLAPCSPRRARMLIDRKRVAKRWYRPFTIQLRSRANNDPVQNDTEVRTTPRPPDHGNRRRPQDDRRGPHRLPGGDPPPRGHLPPAPGTAEPPTPPPEHQVVPRTPVQQPSPKRRPAAALPRERRLEPGAPYRPAGRTLGRQARGRPGQQVRHSEDPQPRNPG